MAKRMGRLLKSHQIANPNSWEAKKFRLRFRVPWPLFLELVRKCRKEVGNQKRLLCLFLAFHLCRMMERLVHHEEVRDFALLI